MKRCTSRLFSGGNALFAGIAFRELRGLAHNWTSVSIAANDIRHEAIHDIRAEWKRPTNVENQHCAHLIAVIDHGVRPAIVEQNGFAFLPDIVLRIDNDLGRILFRHAEPEMITQIAEVWPFML